MILIINTRPKPAYRRQGLAGSWRQETDQAGTFWSALNVLLPASGAKPGYKPIWNYTKTMKNHKNTAGTMRNQSGTMKNPSGKAIKTPKTLHFTNHITKPHQVWVVVVQEVEITPVGDGPG